MERWKQGWTSDDGDADRQEYEALMELAALGIDVREPLAALQERRHRRAEEQRARLAASGLDTGPVRGLAGVTSEPPADTVEAKAARLRDAYAVGDRLQDADRGARPQGRHRRRHRVA